MKAIRAAGLLLLAASVRAQGAKPRIAVVIDDFGLTYPKDQPDADWMALKFPVTFAVMPVSPRTAQAARETKEAGHELIIHFPFDKYLRLKLPADRVDPEDLAKVKALFEKARAQIPEATGLNNHQSLRGTANRPMMAAFMKLLKPTGLFFLDSKVGPKSVAFDEARKSGIPSAVNTYFLDGGKEPKARRSDDPKVLALAVAKDKATCARYLRLAGDVARKKGGAVAIGHHYFQGTYECLVETVPQLQKEGFEFVFASKLAR